MAKQMLSNPSRVSLEALKSDRSTRRRATEAPVRPKGCIRRVQRLYNGCTTVVQGIGKGPTRSQHRSNAGATPEQHARSALATRLGSRRLCPQSPGEGGDAFGIDRIREPPV